MRPEGWIAIVNPLSGGRTGRPARDRIAERARRLAETVTFTERPGHAAELAAAAAGYRGIVVAGGDGTIFEVLQGMNRDRQSVAVLPAGRGNSLARDLAAEPRRIDLLEVWFESESAPARRRVCASTVAVGYPASVAAAANRRFRLLGRYCYAAAGALTRPQPFPAHLAYDNGDTQEVRLTGFIANNTRHIANFLVFPEASSQDGWFDAMELRRGFFGQNLHNLAALAGRDYRPAPPVVAKRVRLWMGQPQVLLLDGELYSGIRSFEVRVLASAVSCGLAA